MVQALETRTALAISGEFGVGTITILVPRIDLNNPGTDIYNSGHAIFTKWDLVRIYYNFGTFVCTRIVRHYRNYNFRTFISTTIVIMPVIQSCYF